MVWSFIALSLASSDSCEDGVALLKDVVESCEVVVVLGVVPAVSGLGGSLDLLVMISQRSSWIRTASMTHFQAS